MLKSLLELAQKWKMSGVVVLHIDSTVVEQKHPLKTCV